MKRELTLTPVILVILAACSSGPDSADSGFVTTPGGTVPKPIASTPTTTAAPVEEASLETPEPALPSATPTVVAQALVDAPLSDLGPWLIYRSQDQETIQGPTWSMTDPWTWKVVNADGSGRRRFEPFDLVPGGPPWQITEGGVAVHGDLMAYFALAEPGFRPRFVLQRLPSLEIVEVLPARGADTHSAPHWSPNGRYLAFHGTLGEDLSAPPDVLLYDVEREAIREIHQGTTAAHTPIWSPDGELLLYHVEIEPAPPGRGGCGVDQLWVLDRVSGSRRYLVELSGDGVHCSNFFGWISPTQFLVWQVGEFYGQNMQQVDALTGQRRPVFEGVWTDWVFDLRLGGVVIRTDVEYRHDYAGVPYLPQALYWIHPSNEAPILLTDKRSSELRWDGTLEATVARVPSVCGSLRLARLEANASFTCVDDESRVPSPDSQWAISSEGGIKLYNAEGEEVRSILVERQVNVIWRLDSAGAFLGAEEALYFFIVPEDQLVLVDGKSRDFLWAWDVQ